MVKKKIQIHKRFFGYFTLLLLLNSLGSTLVTSNLRVLPGMMFVTSDEWSIILSTLGVSLFVASIVLGVFLWRQSFLRRGRPWIGVLLLCLLLYFGGAAVAGLIYGGVFNLLSLTGQIEYETGMLAIEFCSSLSQGLLRMLVVFLAMLSLCGLSLRGQGGLFWKGAILSMAFAAVGTLIGLFLSGIGLWLFGFLWDSMTLIFLIAWTDTGLAERAV